MNLTFAAPKRALQALMACAVVLVLGGCASGVNMLPALSAESPPIAGQGVVVVRVVNASSFSLPFNQLTITPKNYHESKKIKLERLEALVNRTSKSTVFSSAVNSGSYSLSSIRAFHSNGNFWYSRFVSADAEFGTFEVKPGQVTDLGTLIYYPKSQDDKYMDTLMRRPAIENGHVLKQFFPFYEFDERQVIGWIDDEFAEERDSFYVSAATNPVYFHEEYLAPDGSMYFIGKLGVIVKRTIDGEWELDAVDTNLDMLSIAQSSDGHLLLGGNEGKLFIKRAGGEWQDISMAHDMDIGQVAFGADGQMHVFSRKKQGLTVYTAKPGLEGFKVQWKEAATFNTTLGWRPGDAEDVYTSKKSRPKQIVSVKLSKVDGQQLISIRTIGASADPVFAQADNLVYRYNPDQWSFELAKDDTDVSVTLDAGAVQLGIKYAGFWSWTNEPDYLIKDKASGQWREIAMFTPGDKPKSKDHFNFSSVPWFRNGLEGVALVRFEESRDVLFVKTTDGGKSWQRTENKPPKEYCLSLVPQFKDHLLLTCSGSSGDFYESTDEGATWDLVREHETF